MFFTRRFFVVLAAVFVLFVVGYIFPVCFEAARWLICILLSLLAIDSSYWFGSRFREGRRGVLVLFVLYNLLFGYLVSRLATRPIAIVHIIGILIWLILLWPSIKRSETITARRSCSDRFSNGDENEVRITVENRLSIPVHVDIIDELPDIFQRRDVRFPVELKRGEKRGIQEGKKLGAKDEKIKIAGDLKKRGFKDELIAEITGLSKKMIMTLKIPNL